MSGEPLAQTVALSEGWHPSPKSGACVMELVSLLSGDRFCDTPRAAHPEIGVLGAALNDALDDHERQRLVPLAPRIAASAEGLRGTVFPRVAPLCRRLFPPEGIASAPIRLRYEHALGLPPCEESACDLLAGTAILSPSTAIAVFERLLPPSPLDDELTALGGDIGAEAHASI
jgi:hypothetical protein